MRRTGLAAAGLLLVVGCSPEGGSRADVGVSGYSLVDPVTLRLALESCNAEPQLAELVESADSVRVRVVGDKEDPANRNLCSDLITVPLASPLGGRVLVDESSGDQVQQTG